MVDPDDDLESTVERLRDRVDELESQLDGQSRSPATATRRDALKAGGAGALLGALGLGSITSGASADPQGRLGSPSDPVQQAYINNADVTALNAEQMGSERHYAGSYGGGDADARLDNAISAAGDGHTIYLEQATYSDDRSISTSLSFIGPSATAVAGGLGSEVSGTWTFSASCVTDQVRFTGGVTADADSCGVLNGLHTDTAAFEVNGDDFRYIGNINGAVTFANGTQGGIVDACTGTSYTDNDGGNKQGDIA